MAKKALLRDHANIEILPITRGELVLDSSGKVALHSNEFLATTSQPGLMSAEDKSKITNLTGRIIDSDLSTTSTNPVQNKVVTNAINSIKTSYLKSATVSSNILTIVDQSNKEVNFYNTTYGVVSQTADGLAPKLGTDASATIGTQADEWVLTSTKGGTPTWRKLPVNAFLNDNSNTTYTFTSGNGGFTVTPSGGTDQFVGIGYIDGQYINKLTGYTKATSRSAIEATDTLNTTLGKLEYKADLGVTAYDLVNAAYDGDGTIENLTEILKVLEGISDTDTIQAIVGKYLPLTGGMMTGNITFDTNRMIRWHQSDSYSISCPTGGDGAYLLLKAHNGITAKKRLSIYTNAESLPNTAYNLYTDGSLYAASATIGGNTKITGGSDLTLQASSSTSTDPGDLVFADSSGTELGRIWLNGSNFSLRYGSSDPSNTLIHSGNIGSQYVAGLIKSDGNAYVSYNATYGYVNVNGVAIGLNSNTIERVTTGKLYIQKNVTEATIINQYGGNVGIGKDDPTFKLDVAGVVRATSFIKLDSSNSYLLLGGGDHKAISDFLLKSEVANQELSNNLTTITKSLTVTADWMDTGIKYTDLATGTYIVQVSVHDSADGIWYGYWSGVMTWYGSGTNDTQSDEILLHRAGHALGSNIYLRTCSSLNSDGRQLRLQIAASKTLGAAYTYTFKFKRVI